MKRFILPVFFMLVSSGIFILYIDPTYVEIRNAMAKKDTLEKSIADAALAKQQIEHLEAVESTFPVDYTVKLRTLLPDTIDDTRLVIEVNGMAARDGLHIKTPTIGKIASPSRTPLPYVRHSINMSVKAPYSVFRSFLRDLEGNLSLRDAAAVSFSSQETDEDATKYKDPSQIPHEYTLTLVTYSLH